jgi:methionine-rich copper-binding protein CopC
MRSPLFLRATISMLVMLVVAVPNAPTAWAHAVIVDSSPAPNAEIVSGDSDVMLHYNSRIDHSRSRLTLVAPDGAHPLALLPDSAPDVIAARLTGLAAGSYRLRWQVLAVDGHLTRGDIPFRVKTP